MENLNHRILIIEDDKLLAPSLSEYLTQRQFHTILKYSGDDIFDLDLYAIDLVILDLILPGISGEDVLTYIKEKDPNIPVLILTAKYSISSKEECFSKGADDYLTKPFDLLELELRINVLLRRYSRNKIVNIGDTKIDLEKKTLEKGGVEVNLSRRSWDLLSFLLQNRGKIVDKSQIMQSVWTDTYVSVDNIRTYIKELRKILPKEAIKTYKGRGYKLI